MCVSAAQTARESSCSPSLDDARAARQVGVEGDSFPVRFGEKLLQRIGLAVAKFSEEAAVRVQPSGALRRKPSVKSQPVRAAVERQARVKVADFGLKRGDFRRRDVGRIRNDEIEAQFGWQSGKAVAEMERDAARQLVRFCVPLCEREG